MPAWIPDKRLRNTSLYLDVISSKGNLGFFAAVGLVVIVVVVVLARMFLEVLGQSLPKPRTWTASTSPCCKHYCYDCRGTRLSGALREPLVTEAICSKIQ